ncbi:protease complex subunit PrcB family protein [Actinoplanes sp. GCM10030250]|uniref:protease complex subunit PrcB family protein n=1 Tax=Actinoplanes sp. GCM10030250 TaxID=3273376 RepID=UPI0036138932
MDWQTEMCVVAALGACSNTGYSVLIGAITVVGDRMTVLAHEIRPGPNCFALSAITYPFHAVATPAHAGPAEWVKRVAYEDCEAGSST